MFPVKENIFMNLFLSLNFFSPDGKRISPPMDTHNNNLIYHHIAGLVAAGGYLLK